MAVEDPISHAWMRSKIVEIQAVESKILVKVFLVDYGHHLQVCLRSVYALPDFALALWPQAIQFTIYGILPTSMAFKPDINNYSLESVHSSALYFFINLKIF